jgi:hypothetical protein
MKGALQRHRFEVTIQCEGGRVKHVCAAHEKAEAIERMMRSYAKFNPECRASTTLSGSDNHFGRFLSRCDVA